MQLKAGAKNEEQLGQWENKQQAGRLNSNQINNYTKCKWAKYAF